MFETRYELLGQAFLYYALMTLSTMLVAAAGYIINDIRDLEMDKINRPRKYVLQRLISVETARVIYYGFNVSSFVVIAIVGILNQSYMLVLIHPVSMLLLWLYSTDFKCRPLIGNVVVSALTAFIPVLGAIYIYALQPGLRIADMSVELSHVLFVYFLMSFLISWVREMFKDLEDREGDRKHQCRTLAILWKPVMIKRLSYALLLLSVLALLYLILSLQDSPYYLFGSSLVSIPVVILFDLLPRIVKARRKEDYYRISMVSKILMAGGLALWLLLIFA